MSCFVRFAGCKYRIGSKKVLQIKISFYVVRRPRRCVPGPLPAMAHGGRGTSRWRLCPFGRRRGPLAWCRQTTLASPEGHTCIAKGAVWRRVCCQPGCTLRAPCLQCADVHCVEAAHPKPAQNVARHPCLHPSATLGHRECKYTTSRGVMCGCFGGHGSKKRVKNWLIDK